MVVLMKLFQLTTFRSHCQNQPIFKDKNEIIELCVSRFDDDTKQSFLDLYTKVDNYVELSEETEPNPHEDVEEESPFIKR